MRSKRVALFVPSLRGGGAERQMLNLAAGLSQRGYATDLVLAQALGPHMSDVPETVRLVDLGASRVLASLPPLVRYLRSEQPAVMLSALRHANLVAVWARKLARSTTRLVVSERNTMPRGAIGVRRRWTRSLARRFYRSADAVVAVSHRVADDLALAGVRDLPIRVIFNPVIGPGLQRKAQAEVPHAWLRPAEPPVILAAGRLVEQKDFGTLIQAFAQVRRRRRARLLILGEGPQRPALEALVRRLQLESDVQLPGFTPNPYAYMTRAAVFVLSSRWEGLPGVLIEALYCGSPVVATDCPGGPREILGCGRHGQLVAVGDVAGMARSIEAALDGGVPRPSPESWRPFELQTVLDQYLDVFFGPCSAP
jgi:glycosyltransferase involved in cell wall biosynthesis